MSEHPRNLDRDTAERLLDGASPTPGARADRLARLLAAAGGPPRPYEYAREEQAMAAFRAARLAPRSRRRVSWRSLLTFKVLAATATVTVSGLAFASSTGIIPTPFTHDPGNSATPSVATSGPGRSGTGSAGSHPSTMPTAANGVAIIGLCNAYLAKAPEDRAKALETPAFADLVTAANGAQKVDDYCTKLVEKDKADKSHSPKPTHEPTQVQTPVPTREPMTPRTAPR